MAQKVAAVFCVVMSAAGCASSEQNSFPTSTSYPTGTMQRVTLKASVPEEWNLSVLTTNRPQALWKLVIITGTPSWSEFWAPTLAGAPDDLEVVVADRPGFSASGPDRAVTDIATQARALSILLEPTNPNQRVILMGQSYGGPISTLMAADQTNKVSGLILVSAFFGERGPTIHQLSFAGSLGRGLLDRELRNGLDELKNQKPQLPTVFSALEALTQPIVVLHGQKDTFVPMAAAQRLAVRARATFINVPKGDHFLNACCVSDIMKAVALVREKADAANP